jgi:hypothetical protein
MALKVKVTRVEEERSWKEKKCYIQRPGRHSGRPFDAHSEINKLQRKEFCPVHLWAMHYVLPNNMAMAMAIGYGYGYGHVQYQTINPNKCLNEARTLPVLVTSATTAAQLAGLCLSTD